MEDNERGNQEEEEGKSSFCFCGLCSMSNVSNKTGVIDSKCIVYMLLCGLAIGRPNIAPNLQTTSSNYKKPNVTKNTKLLLE